MLHPADQNRENKGSCWSARQLYCRLCTCPVFVQLLHIYHTLGNPETMTVGRSNLFNGLDISNGSFFLNVYFLNRQFLKVLFQNFSKSIDIQWLVHSVDATQERFCCSYFGCVQSVVDVTMYSNGGTSVLVNWKW